MRILGSPPARVKAGAAAKILPVRAPLVVGIVVVASFLGLMLWTTEGHFVAQVSDLYVVAQYARALAEGHPFRYNAGEAPTSGATSLLHTAVLALADASGARGEGLIAFAVLLGAALYLASIPLAARVAERLSGPREGRLAGMLVALSGPVVWGFLYGSDIAPFLFLALLLLERWLAYCAGGPARGLALAGSLLALCRPEGLPVGLALAAAGRWRRPASPAERLWLWLPLATGLAVLTLQRIVTGSWLQTSVAEKALLPSYGPVETLAAATQYGVDVLRGLLLGLYPPETAIGFARGEAAFFFPPLALVLVLLAVARSEAPLAVPARLWLALVLLIFALTGPNVFMGVHFNRYLMWAFPGLLAFVAAGLGALARLAARDDARLENDLFRAGAALALLLGALSTAHFAGVYAQLAGSTWRREIPMAGVHPRTAAEGRRDRQRRDQRGVPDRPPQPEPARRDEPRLRGRPQRRARGRDVRVARPDPRVRAPALPAPDACGTRGLGADAGSGSRPARVCDDELRGRPGAVPGQLGARRRR